MTTTSSNAERARALMTEIDTLWERCQNGIDLVFPAHDDDPDLRKRAAKHLVNLINQAADLEREAVALDPSAVREWGAKREAMYAAKGWSWPPNKDEAKETRMELVQLAWAD